MCSSAMTMHAAPIADALAILHVICNRFDVDTDGRLTGAIVRLIIWEPARRAAKDFCAANDIELQHSYFYADGTEDLLLMLEVVISPGQSASRTSVAAAAERGRPVLRAGRPARRAPGPPGIGLNT
jgi:phosphoserine phosphatase